MALTVIVTNAGRAALVNAANTGTAAVTIAAVGVSGTAVTPSKTATALPGETKRIATLSGAVVADDTIHLIVRDESSDVLTVRSFALYLADGTLFAIYGQATPVLEKSSQATMLLAIDVTFADVTAAQLTFGNANFLNPPATQQTQGVVELATVTEARAGTDTERALTPAVARAALLTWLLGMDGAGSGIDSDLLDGRDGAYYADIAARLGFTPANSAGQIFSGDIGRDSGFLMRLLGSTPALFFADDSGGADRIEFDRTTNTWTYVLAGVPCLRVSAAGIQALGGNIARDKGFFMGLNGGTPGLFFADDGGGADRIEFDRPTNTWTFLLAGLPCLRVSATAIEALNGPMFKRGSATVWDSGNDGAGSGLDADTLDGLQASAFERLTSVNYGSYGYRTSVDGFKICWSQITVPANSTVNVTLPITYNLPPRVIVSGMARAAYTDQDNGGLLSGSETTNRFTIVNGLEFTADYSWLAIGN